MRQTHRLVGPALMVLVLVAAACGDDGGTSDSVAETAAAEGTAAAEETTAAEPTDGEDEAAVATGGLEISSVQFGDGTAQLINTGDSPIDLTGLWVCNRPNYAELPATELAPGEGIEIGVVGMTEAGGEVAIYTSNDFGNSDEIVSYVHWGSGGGRASVAEEAGIWSGPPVEGGSDGIDLIGEPGSAAGWS